MKTKDTKQLKAFLKMKRLYTRFCKYVKQHSNLDFAENGELTTDKSGAISEAFYWNHTLEGAPFWGDVNKEWEAIVRAEVLTES